MRPRQPAATSSARSVRRGEIKTGCLRVLTPDEREWVGDDPPGMVVPHAPDLADENAADFLAGFIDILQMVGDAGCYRMNRRSSYRHYRLSSRCVPCRSRRRSALPDTHRSAIAAAKINSVEPIVYFKAAPDVIANGHPRDRTPLLAQISSGDLNFPAPLQVASRRWRGARQSSCGSPLAPCGLTPVWHCLPPA